MSIQEVVFGFGAHSGIDDGPELLRMAEQADRDGLDLFSLSDHPYLGERLDAYASVGFILGRTGSVGPKSLAATDRARFARPRHHNENLTTSCGV